MSRSGYCDDSEDNWQLIRWRGAVKSAVTGKRGQAFLKEMLAALDAMPVKALAKDDLEATIETPISHWGLVKVPSVCAIGAVGKARGMNMDNLDPHDPETVAGAFGISDALAREIVYENDEWSRKETPEDRFTRMRNWVAGQILYDDANCTHTGV